MRKGLISFWGKIKKDQAGAVIAWHPLIDHCADVAACTQALLGQPNIRKRIAACGGVDDFDEIQQERLCVLAALHDVGKFNIGFQNKALARPPFIAGHVTETVWLLNSGSTVKTEFLNAVGIRDLMHWADDDSLPRLLIAAICHHGRPVACNGRNANTSLWLPRGELRPLDGVRDLVASTKSWFPAAFSPDAETLPSRPELQHAFSGLVMLADWLASDEHFFPFSKDDDGGRFAFAQKQAQKVCDNLFLNPVRAVEALGNKLPEFSDIFSFPPRGIQVGAEHIETSHNGSLVIFEAETGSGKTEAAFRHFVRLFHARKVDGMYFALPTRTAATQIHARITRYVQKTFGENAPPVTLAVPGYLRTDEIHGKQLAPFDVLWNDNEKERYRYRGWAAEHPKRYLAGSIVIGTIDQALLSALTVSHAHLRATALLRHLLIVDEVHASDPYMRRILSEVIKRHVAAGGHALLMSATIASGMREKLLCMQEHPSLEEAVTIPYPVIWEKGNNVRHIATPHAGKQKTVTTELASLMNDEAKIAAVGLAAAQKGAKVVILRNTVNGAITVQKSLEEIAGNQTELLFTCNGILTLHHSRFAREDREELDAALEALYGPTRPPDGRIVVATQTIQQSLDLDADFLITDLCPADVLLQRIGRLHRHDRSPEERPLDYQNPRVVVLVPDNRDLSGFIHAKGEARGPHGIGTVYPDLRILEATWQVLEKHPTVEIPAMNRKLVESAMHSESMKTIVTDDVWQEHSNYIEGIIHAQSQTAGLNVVEWDKEFGEYSFGDIGSAVKSRLGEGDRIVDFERDISSPFGRTFRCLTIPSQWAKGIAEDEKPKIIEENGSKIVFEIGGVKFIYDRWGLRTGSDEHPAETDD